MKTVRILSLVVAALLTIGLTAGCATTPAPAPASDVPSAQAPADQSSTPETVTIRGIVDLVPHSELIEFVRPTLAEQGIIIELVATAADETTNERTAKGEADFNFFQHYPYLNAYNETNSTKLFNVGDIHVEPITAYSDKYDSIDKLPENAVVAVPNNPTNEYRALRILAENGFIKLNEATATSLSASLEDVTEYLKPIKIVEIDAAQIIPTKDDYDFFITNTNRALEAKITSHRLFSEGGDSPYANIIAVREEDRENPAILALVKALQSEETRKFIEEKYNGAVIPAKLK